MARYKILGDEPSGGTRFMGIAQPDVPVEEYEQAKKQQIQDLKNTWRPIGIVGANFAENAIGGIPALAQGASQLGNYAYKKATGAKEGPLPEQIPLTPEWLKYKLRKPLTGDYLEPTNKFEKFTENVAADVGSLNSIPGRGKLPFANTVGNTLATAIYGNIAKEGVEAATGSKGAAEAAKIATNIYRGIQQGRPAVEKMRDSAYAAQNVAINAKSSVKNLTLFDQIKKIYGKNDINTASEFMKGIYDKFEKAYSKGKGIFSVENLVDIEKQINDQLYKGNLTETAKNAALQVKKLVNEAINNYGRYNKEFLHQYTLANGLHAALEAPSFFTRLAKENKNVAYFLDKLTSAGLYPFLKNIKENPIFSAAGGGALLGGANIVNNLTKITELAYRHPAALKAYKDLSLSMAIQNAPLAERSLKKIYDVAHKYKIIGEEEQPKQKKYKII
jgi:hypothetical protein